MSGIDLHTHLAPELPGVDRAGPPALYQPERLEAHLDTAGLDEAIVTIPPPYYRQHLSAVQAAAWVAAVNDAMLAVVANRPRLTPLAYLPLEHPTVALAEYDRIAGDSRWAGVVAAAGAHSVSLADLQLRVLWARLDADERTVQLHPGISADRRLDPYSLANLLGSPVETTLAAAQLIFGEILIDFPRIRFILAHGGGCLAAVVGRWERGYATSCPGVPPLAVSPRGAARRLYVDALTHDPVAIDLAIHVVGADHVVLGSDWPFPMGTENPTAAVAHRGETYAQQVATTNAASALGRS